MGSDRNERDDNQPQEKHTLKTETNVLEVGTRAKRTKKKRRDKRRGPDLRGSNAHGCCLRPAPAPARRFARNGVIRLRLESLKTTTHRVRLAAHLKFSERRQ